MALFDSITTRKSVRAYSPEPLDEKTCAKIVDFAEKAERLRPEIGLLFTVLTPNQVKGLGNPKAPQYLAVYTEVANNHLVNVGFVLQQVDLYISSLGLGSCWAGGYKAAAKATEVPDGYEFGFVLAFGAATEEVHRSDLADFIRKPAAEVYSGTDPRLEYARLAPSAANGQNWFFAAHDGGIDVYRKELGALKKRLFGRMSYIDMGIALAHLRQASKHFRSRFNFRVNWGSGAPERPGYEYIGTI